MRARVAKPKRHFAKSLRATATDAEIKLWRLLRSRRLAHFKFRRQVPIGSWIVDFVCYEHHLVVEADGSQHSVRTSDAKRDDDLKQRGFSVLRFWNNDILLRSNDVAETIFAAANSPSPGALRAPPSPTRGEGKQSA